MNSVSRYLNKLPFAPVVAAMFAIVAVVLVAATPGWLFERWVAASGIAALVPAAAPPLGVTARAAAALLAGVATGALLWLASTLAERLMRVRTPRQDSEPLFAMHPRPLWASDELGAPLMSEAAIEHARDELVLDMPMAEPDADAPKLTEIERKTHGEEAVITSEQGPATVEDTDVERPSAFVLRPIAQDTIATLLNRLDAAIARKSPGYRPNRGDMATLRRALSNAR